MTGSDHPVARTAATCGLHQPLTTFVGRHAELATLRRLLASARAVTVLGLGGAGKTRLAGRLAEETVRAFAGGVRLVSAGPATTEVLADLRGWAADSADEPLLLVLDACEVAPAAWSAAIEHLLRTVPRLTVLATSRVRLTVSGGIEYRIPPLSLPPAGDVAVAEIRRTDAVALFLDRAAAADPVFAVGPHNVGAVSALCRLLDGSPAAIEWAAARVRALSPAQMLRRLDEMRAPDDDPPGPAPGLGLLGPSGGGARAGGMRAVLADTAAGCTPLERRLWSRVSVFRGEFRLDEVETLCCDDDERADAAEAVTGLLDRSVLAVRHRHQETRYRLAHCVRMFGREELAARDELAGLTLRLRDWLLDLAERSRPFWRGAGEGELSDRLLNHLDDVRAAVDTSLRESRPDLALRLLVASRPQWMLAGEPGTGSALLATVLDAYPEQDELRVRGLATSAYLLALDGRAPESAAAVAAARGSDSGGVHAAELAYAEGLTAWQRADLPGALERLYRAVDLAGIARDEAQVHEAAFALGLAVARLGRDGLAHGVLDVVESTIAHMTAEGGWWNSCWARLFRGVAAMQAQDEAVGVVELRRCLRMLSGHHDRVLVWWCLELLAWAASVRGDHATAMRLQGAARTHGLSAAPPLPDRRAAAVAAAEANLGTRAAARLRRVGAALTLDDALDLALGENAASSENLAEALSEREQQVARFVARGMSNREIAAELVISPRTAEGHVQRVLRKRGFGSRAQIAAWIAQLDADDR